MQPTDYPDMTSTGQFYVSMLHRFKISAESLAKAEHQRAVLSDSKLKEFSFSVKMYQDFLDLTYTKEYTFYHFKSHFALL